MEEWVACLFFNSRPQQLNEEQLEMSNEFLTMLQDKLGFKLCRRRSDQQPIRKILLTLDAPVIYHRPFAYYAVVRFIDMICRFIMNFLGFQRRISGTLPYSIRRGTSSEPAVVFFHGLGIGNFQ